jgi:hypothetical protein
VIPAETSSLRAGSALLSVSLDGCAAAGISDDFSLLVAALAIRREWLIVFFEIDGSLTLELLHGRAASRETLSVVLIAAALVNICIRFFVVAIVTAQELSLMRSTNISRIDHSISRNCFRRSLTAAHRTGRWELVDLNFASSSLSRLSCRIGRISFCSFG